MSVPKNLTSLFETSIRENWENRALTDYGGSDYTYEEVARRILAIHGIFRETGIKKGDKIVLLGKNSANWGIIYIATVTYGAVIVPILPDFKPADIHYITTHSDACLIFVEEFIFKELNMAEMPLIRMAFRIQTNEVLYCKEDEYRISNNEFRILNEGTSEITPEMIRFEECSPEDLAVISYTSGTTGFSKGVVLQHKSLYENILYAQRNMPLKPKDKILSFLPLAHTYGCAFEFLFPFTFGCDITFLTKTPSPKIIMQAFQEIRPALILSVPLVIEKIYKTQILPLFRKPSIRILLAVPGVIAYAATDGTELWRVECLNGEITPSPAFGGGLLFVPSPSEKLLAIRPDGQGDVTKTHVVWTSEDNVPDVTSPLSNGELVFMITTSGMLTCLDAKDGKKQWDHDYEMEFHASPSLAGGRLYLFSQKGTAVVVEAARQFKELLRTEMGDAFHATPAFAQDRIFLRGVTNVWCLGAAAAPDKKAGQP